MSRMRDDHKERLPPFVPLLIDTLDSPAWRATSHGAKALYIILRRKYGVKLGNNGRIYLSVRDAAEALGSNKDSVAKWFRELQHYGFIVMTSPGCLGIDGMGKAPSWRLTELGTRTPNEPPTRDFVEWDGTVFVDTFLDPTTRTRPRKTKTRPQKCGQGDPKSGDSPDPKSGDTQHAN